MLKIGLVAVMSKYAAYPIPSAPNLLYIPASLSIALTFYINFLLIRSPTPLDCNVYAEYVVPSIPMNATAYKAPKPLGGYPKETFSLRIS